MDEFLLVISGSDNEALAAAAAAIFQFVNSVVKLF
jgi:hypothetical protein